MILLLFFSQTALFLVKMTFEIIRRMITKLSTAFHLDFIDCHEINVTSDLLTVFQNRSPSLSFMAYSLMKTIRWMFEKLFDTMNSLIPLTTQGVFHETKETRIWTWYINRTHRFCNFPSPLHDLLLFLNCNLVTGVVLRQNDRSIYLTR